MKFEWEEIYSFYDADEYTSDEITFRAKVPGGWLVRHARWFEPTILENMIFIADPEHKWEIEK